MSPTACAIPCRCCPANTTVCGNLCCTPYEQCSEPYPNVYSCGVDNSTAVRKRFNLTTCGKGPSASLCPHCQCHSRGYCCPHLSRPCGETCCGQSDECVDGKTCCPKGRYVETFGAGACCQEGSTPCGDECCWYGAVCNPVAARSRRAGRRCCEAGTTPCGTSSCCVSGETCHPDANGGLGLCCPEGGTLACGLNDCCAPRGQNITCVKSAAVPEGRCCGGKESFVCGTSQCCWRGSEKCVDGKCVPLCSFPGEKPRAKWVPCGQGCCDGTCCGNSTCCRPGTRCCGDKCCTSTEKCQLSRDKTRGTCVEPACGSREVCGGVCCRRGQVCSADGLKCCSPRDAACLVSTGSPVVQCGGEPPTPDKACRLWEDSCFMAPSNGSTYCCRKGTLACPGAPSGKCCPAGTVCSAKGLRWDGYTELEQLCCPRDSLPCGDACCDGKKEWCHRWLYKHGDDDGGQGAPTCFPRTWAPCGRTACPRNHTCYASGRFGWGLCCPPGTKACRGEGHDGQLDFWRCC